MKYVLSNEMTNLTTSIETSVMSTTPPPLRHINMLRMDHAQMTSQSVIPAECLLLGTQVTMNFLLARIVDGVLVPREIVWPREDGVAGLSCRWIDSLALVGARL